MHQPNESLTIAQRCRDSFVKLWQDEAGFVVSMELILIVTILVIGMIAGLTALRDAVVGELTDVARSVQQMNQSYSVNGVENGSASTSGSGFQDHNDGGSSTCIVVFGPPDES
ncbi:hypothetical protein [Planctomycetes bacterium K23_9]|uniref:Uncharacterized protein n=1 Tax=Stieleria marina TaxID=1930275 RepID=A0A517NYY7_9BACT|nr:hypothetical protein K239x_43490 [Planctomycetes bacterium K23_9]